MTSDGNSMQASASPRRLLFISFAAADVAAAEWLAEHLLLAGYQPWLDKQRLHGGDQWSPEITRVLREETFRVLHLVSRFSLQDSYAVPERQRARSLGRERRQPVLVPLLMEPLPHSEWPIEIEDLVPIPFQDWGEGLERLLAELAAADAPKLGDGTPQPMEFPWQGEVVKRQRESLFSNALSVEGLPMVVHHYRRTGPLTGDQWKTLRAAWAFWNPYQTPDILCFHAPPAELIEAMPIDFERTVAWSHVDSIASQPTASILPAVLRRSFTDHAIGRGLARWRESVSGQAAGRGRDWLYVPRGLFDADKVRVRNWAGKTVPIKLVGERNYQGEPFLAHLAISPFFEQIGDRDWLTFLRLGVRPAKPDGSPFEGRAVGPRVKQATRAWTNEKLLARQRAILGILAGDDGLIRLGPDDQPQILLRPLGGEVGVALDEAALGALGADPAGGEDGMVDAL
jgi:hypothetical protein